VVKELIAKAGIPGDYAGHSLRAGLATAAAAAGVPERAIMAQTAPNSKGDQASCRFTSTAALF
jgi:hypothetical protein